MRSVSGPRSRSGGERWNSIHSHDIRAARVRPQSLSTDLRISNFTKPHSVCAYRYLGHETSCWWMCTLFSLNSFFLCCFFCSKRSRVITSDEQEVSCEQQWSLTLLISFYLLILIIHVSGAHWLGCHFFQKSSLYKFYVTSWTWETIQRWNALCVIGWSDMIQKLYFAIFLLKFFFGMICNLIFSPSEKATVVYLTLLSHTHTSK